MTELPTKTPMARRMWHLVETIHAIVYFASETTAAYRRLGLEGFWMGYFASRAAPLGPASAELVTATFFNFHPDMVARALPGAWRIATSAEILTARQEALDEAMQRILGDVADDRDIGEVADLLEQAAAGCSLAGRPLFAAHAALSRPAAPHLRLWHAATLIREHRGDGHIAAQLGHGFTGIDAHITFCATGALPRATIQPHRGWSDQDWEHATQQLVEAGVVDEQGTLTDAGRRTHASVEERTDQLAAEPWRRIGHAASAHLAALLEPVAASIVSSGTLPFPNPMGLPAPTEDDR